MPFIDKYFSHEETRTPSEKLFGILIGVVRLFMSEQADGFTHEPYPHDDPGQMGEHPWGICEPSTLSLAIAIGIGASVVSILCFALGVGVYFNARKNREASGASTKPEACGASTKPCQLPVLQLGHITGTALHRFNAKYPTKELSVSAGDVLRSTGQTQGNWIELKNQSGETGFVPMNHISFATSTARFDFEAKHADIELSVTVGEVLTPTGESKGAWVKVTKASGEHGFVPVEYLSAPSLV